MRIQISGCGQTARLRQIVQVIPLTGEMPRSGKRVLAAGAVHLEAKLQRNFAVARLCRQSEAPARRSGLSHV